jgi:hypothetical protein
VRWDLLGRTVEGRPIEYAQFGNGQKHVLVVGSLAGDEPEGVAAAEALAASLTKFPRRLQDVKLTIVRDPNPDGRAKRTAANARGVLLDRNFPSANWRELASGKTLVSGPNPLSEPETQALAELLEDVKPDRVVILGAASKRTSVLFAGPAEDLARQLTLEAEGVLVPRDGTRWTGSLLMLAGEDRAIPTIRMGFPPRVTAEEVFSANKRAIMTAAGCGTAMPFPAGAGRMTPQQSVASTATSVPAAINSNRAASSPYLGSFGTASANPNGSFVEKKAAERAAAAPMAPAQTIDFETIRNGRPLVPIASPRSRNGYPVESPALMTTNIAPVAPAPSPNVERRFERLPPVNVFQMPRADTSGVVGPQPPIPAYPHAQ